jgi:uncharacterized protein YbbK (DUF523 family)
LILVSACLAGVKCRYEGDSRVVESVMQLVADGRALPVCPEQLGGLTTPRIPAQIISGDGDDVIDGTSKVLAEDGTDVTVQYLRGAEEVVRMARLVSARLAILKERSPACGCEQICRDGGVIAGKGVAAALLVREGFEVVSDEEYVSGGCEV